jgi:hypothetical protein
MPINKTFSSKLVTLEKTWPPKAKGTTQGEQPKGTYMPIIKVSRLSYIGKDMAIKAKGTTQGNTHTYIHAYYKSLSSTLVTLENTWPPRQGEQHKGTHTHTYIHTYMHTCMHIIIIAQDHHIRWGGDFDIKKF